MGNRVSTSQAAFSLEELESLARAPSLLDSLPAELQQYTITTTAAATTATSSTTTATGAGGLAGSPHRKEALKAELERLYAEYDTSLHALRCVLDRTGTRHQKRSSSQAPVTAAAAASAATRPGRSRSATKGLGSHGRKPAAVDSSEGADRVVDVSDTAASDDAATGAIASSTAATAPRRERRRAASRGPTLKPTSTEANLSPRSWLFREVSVQPVDLSRAAEVKPAEAYILIIVQRVNLNTTSVNAAAAAAGANQEWPRDMAHVFSPRGLTTPFSTDMTRPTLASSPAGAGVGVGAGGWYSPSATPRTNGSASNRPTPRSAPVGGVNAGAAGNPQASPRSLSSQPSPRTTGFHFSVHLLTGKLADAMTATAGLFAARAVEKLFLDQPDFARRLFYNVNAERTEAMIKAYSLYAAPEAPSAGGAAAGTGRRAGGSSSSGGVGRSARSSSSRAAAAARGEAATATATASADVSAATAGRGGGGGGGAGSSAVAGTSLQHISASIEAQRELRRELLALLRPAPVVPPRFDKRMTTAVSPSSSGEHAMPFTSVSSNTAELYSVNAVYRVLNGVRLGTPRWMHHGDLVSPLGSARYSIPGPAGGGPGGAGSAAAGGAGGGVTGGGGGGGTLGWHHDPLPVFRPPPPPSQRRSGTVDSGVSHGTVTSVPTLNFSSWLQGPQPLDVHRAAPAAAANAAANTTGTASTSAASAGGGGGGGTTTPRIGRPPRRAWTPSSATITSTTAVTSASAGVSNAVPTAPPPLPLPKLPLGTLSGGALDRRSGAGTPSPDAATAMAAAPPSLSPRSSISALSPPPQSTSPSTVTAAVPGSTTGFSLSLPLGALRQPTATGGSGGGAATAAVAGTSSAHTGASERPALSALPIPAPQSMSHHHPHHYGRPRGDSPMGQTEDAAVEPDGISGNGNGDAAMEDVEDFNEVHTQQERAQRLKAAQPEVTEVLPYLFVGGEDAARDRAQLLRKGITHVVNTVNWCLDNFYPDLFRYLTLSLSDAAEEPIFPLFALVNAFIEEAVEKHDGRVFVHCQQGVSRSCTFIIAYVMWKQGLCYDRAYDLVRGRRNVCSPNFGFLMNLRLWEAQLATPLLNAVYAFAPYAASAPMPLTYQLAAYFDCATSSTTTTTTHRSPSTTTGAMEGDAAAAAAAASALWTESAGAPASGSESASASASSTTSPVPPPVGGTIPPAEREAHLQLRGDVLTRAVNMVSRSSSGPAAAAAARTLSLDPRLAYLFLFAPARRTSVTSASTTTVAASNTGGAEGGVITGCVTVGPRCLNAAYTAQALAACHTFLRCSFYHGPPVTSRTNAGRVLRFTPLRPVRLLLPPSPRVTAPLPPPPPSSSRTAARYSAVATHATTPPGPVASVSPEEAQRQLAAQLGSRAAARVVVTPQREWDAFFAPGVRLGTALAQHVAEEARLDASETARRHARAAALREVDLVATTTAAARSGRTASSSQPTSRSSYGAGPMPQLPSPLPPTHPHHAPSGASSASFRTGRHTPRTPRHTTHTTTTGGGGVSGTTTASAAVPGASSSVSGNGGSTSLPPPPHAAPATAAAAAGDGSIAGASSTQPPGLPPRLSLQLPLAPLPTTTTTASTAAAGAATAPASLSLSSAPFSAAATATEAVGSAARKDGSDAALLLSLPLGHATPPHPHRSGAHNGTDGGGGSSASHRATRQTVSPVTMSLAAGESFAYAFPFTATAKVTISDLDDLDGEQCYALGFQERVGTSVYLWRGAQATEEAADVVHAFVQHMLCETGGSADHAEEAVTADDVVAALGARAWCTCFIHLPELAATGGGAAAAAPLLMRVRVLYVDEGEEPKEFFTLL